ncbi:Catechol-2,3-dioxygenase [Bacillus sp. THAF10]|uniref:VOC family protein n=1 Tax=Bacillus sp. THAF10 TaxID=2587848 RepID=UPI0012681365|nr:VOC family protein [Bacillus sp. THAF10]QFT88115.1 Catechol-2,3-dioxygenase [Bacillus sp. THAF10]
MAKFHQAPATFVGEVYLQIQNLRRSIEFYTNVIGFRLLMETETKATFTADGTTPILSVEQREDFQPKQPRTTGLYHFALLLPSREDLGSMLQHFVSNNIRLQGASDHLVSEALYLSDPDGNGIEIYCDRSASTWTWKGEEVEMASVALDAESLLEEGSKSKWSGLPEKTIMGHIHLHVSDLTAAETFYTELLGFAVVTRYGGQALFISTEKYHHHIGLNTWNGVGAPKAQANSIGLGWYTLVYPSEGEKQAVVSALREQNIPIEEENGAFFTTDPSGNKIRLV